MRRFLPLIFSLFLIISFAEMSRANTIERKSFFVGKTKVIEVLERDSQSRVFRRSLITSDMTEISFYDPQTTAPTAWIVKNAEREIEAKFPIDGVFRRLELKKRKDKSEDRFVFIYNTQTESYRLAEAENVPDKIYQRAFEDVRITRGIDRCRAVKDMRTPFREMAALLEQSRDEAVFLERLNQPDAASKLFDRSCRESSSSTLSDPEDMSRTKEALAEIMGSSLKDSPSRYLKCMTDQGLSLHAAEIEALLIGAVEMGVNVLNRTEPLITCEPNMISRELAHYNVTNGQINITRKPSQMVPDLVVPEILEGGAGFSPQLPASQVRQNHVRKEIGQTLFHELIHASGIEEENFVEDITLCCGNGFNENTESCRRMKSEIDRLERIQTAEVLLKGGEWPWYTQLQEQLTYGDVTTESKRAFEKEFAREFDEAWRESREWGDECYQSSESQVECNEKFGSEFREKMQKAASDICNRVIVLKDRSQNKEKFCTKLPSVTGGDFVDKLPHREVPRSTPQPSGSTAQRQEGPRQPSPSSGAAPAPSKSSMTKVSGQIPARIEASERPRVPVPTQVSSRTQPATLELPRDLDRGTEWQGSERSEFAGRATRDSSGSFVSPLGSTRPDLQRDIERPRQFIETMSKLAEQAGLTIPQARADSNVNQNTNRGSTLGARSPASESSTDLIDPNQVDGARKNAQVVAAQTSSNMSSGVQSRRSSSVNSAREEGARPKGKRKKKSKKDQEESQPARRVSSSAQGFVPETTHTDSGAGSLRLIATIEHRPETLPDLLQSARFQESLIRNKILLIDADQREYGAREPEQVYRYNPRTRRYEKQVNEAAEGSP